MGKANSLADMHHLVRLLYLLIWPHPIRDIPIVPSPSMQFKNKLVFLSLFSLLTKAPKPETSTVLSTNA